MSQEAGGWTYIFASARFGTLYVGSTTDLLRRVYAHKGGLRPGFTRRYGVTMLVWYEPHDSVASAYGRERTLMKWRRAWKIALIEEKNPYWNDLYPAGVVRRARRRNATAGLKPHPPRCTWIEFR